MKTRLFVAVCVLVLAAVVASSPGFAAPKKTIAVSDFENKSGWRGSWELGQGMQEMMATALINTGKFTVLERQDLDAIMQEQDLGASGRSAEGSAAAIGKLGRAQILIAGAVTEFEDKKEGQSGGFGAFGVRVGGSTSQAHVGLNIRVFDTTTGEVLDSIRVTGSASSSGFKISAGHPFGGSDFGSFQKTPIGEATQQAINDAAQRISARLNDVPWQGKIIKATAGKAYINAGSSGGIENGMEFEVLRPGEALIDPDTGMNLGSETARVGRIQVTSVQDKFSIAKIIDGGDLEKGDLVSGD